MAVASGALALSVIGAIAAGGTLVLARLVRRTPVVQARTARGGVWHVPALRVLLAIAGAVGAAFGALEVAAPAVAVAQGVPALGGVLVAAFSLGGVLGVLLYGARRWTASPARRLVVLLLLLSIAVAPLAALRDAVPLSGAVLFLTGLALSPVLTTLSVLVAEHVPTASAEAFGWLSTWISLGEAGGSAAAGLVAQSAGPSSGFVVAALGASAALVVSAWARRGLAR